MSKKEQELPVRVGTQIVPIIGTQVLPPTTHPTPIWSHSDFSFLPNARWSEVYKNVTLCLERRKYDNLSLVYMPIPAPMPNSSSSSSSAAATKTKKKKTATKSTRVVSNIQNLPLPCIYGQYTRHWTILKEERAVKVLFLDSLSLQDCAPFILQALEEKKNHLIFICNYCNVSCQQIIDRLSLHPHSPLRKLLYEVMDTSLFLHDFLSHKYIKRAYPEEVYSPRTSRLKLQELQREPHQVLQYVARDPIVRYFGIRPGQLVRIRRFGEPNGEEIVYRMLNT